MTNAPPRRVIKRQNRNTLFNKRSIIFEVRRGAEVGLVLANRLAFVVQDGAPIPQPASAPTSAEAAQTNAPASNQLAASVEAALADPAPQSTVVQINSQSKKSTPLWIKVGFAANCLLTIAALSIAMIGSGKIQTATETVEAQADKISEECSYNRAVLNWMRGAQLDRDHPLWSENYSVVDLDREVMLQIPTRCGVVNVQRLRPKSLNDRAMLMIRVTNPNMVTLCRGKLTVRSSSEARGPAPAHEYENLGKWSRSLRKQQLDIPNLAPGASEVIEVSVREYDNSDPAYVDFGITFDYFQPSA